MRRLAREILPGVAARRAANTARACEYPSAGTCERRRVVTRSEPRRSRAGGLQRGHGHLPPDPVALDPRGRLRVEVAGVPLEPHRTALIALDVLYRSDGGRRVAQRAEAVHLLRVVMERGERPVVPPGDQGSACAICDDPGIPLGGGGSADIDPVRPPRGESPVAQVVHRPDVRHVGGVVLERQIHATLVVRGDHRIASENRHHGQPIQRPPGIATPVLPHADHERRRNRVPIVIPHRVDPAAAVRADRLYQLALRVPHQRSTEEVQEWIRRPRRDIVHVDVPIAVSSVIPDYKSAPRSIGRKLRIALVASERRNVGAARRPARDQEPSAAEVRHEDVGVGAIEAVPGEPEASPIVGQDRRVQLFEARRGGALAAARPRTIHHSIGKHMHGVDVVIAW